MTARRLAMPAVALLATVLALTGCATARLPGAAAIVDDRTITTDDVVTASRQVNAALADEASPIYNPQSSLTEKETVFWLILAPFIDQQASNTGHWVPDTAYNTTLSAIPHPAESTTTLVRALLSSQSLTDEDKSAILDAARKAAIEVNPRFGTLDLQRGNLPAYSPKWIKPSPTPTATAR